MQAQHPQQTAVGLGVIALGALVAVGAVPISGDAGYGGVGPNFLPWCVAVLLLLCGVAVLREARTGGFRGLGDDDAPAAPGDWRGFLWVSAGILCNAALITSLGFILSCSLCFVLAVRGYKASQGRLDLGARAWAVDAGIGALIAAPVYWLFTQGLAISLPGLTATGWL